MARCLPENGAHEGHMKPEPGIEVLGACLGAIYDGFGAFRSAASKFLLQHKLGTLGADKLATFSPADWYPLESFLAAYHAIQKEVGDQAIYAVGTSIAPNAPWPPFVTDVDSALQSLDVAYHMNHRKNGLVMADAQSGKMIEGIGHYSYQSTGATTAMVRCDNPYPCDFDRGIIFGIGQRWSRSRVLVEHDDGSCRKYGDMVCVYRVTK
jgi:hypothetical protein